MKPTQLTLAAALLLTPIARAADDESGALDAIRAALAEPSPSLSFTRDQPPASPAAQPLDGETPKGFVHNRDSIPDRPAWIFVSHGRYERTTRADVGGDPGSVGVTRSALAGNLIFGPEHDLQISIPFDYETSTYSFRMADDLFPGGANNIRSFEQWTITPNIEAKIDDHWGVFGGGLIFIAGQYDANNTATYGGFGGAIWRPDKTFTLRLGIGARTRLEDDIQILPAIWMEWKIDERTRLTSQGNNIRFEHDFHEAWCIKADLALERRAYRLDDDGPAPGAVFRDSQIPVSLRMEFVPHAAARFEAWIGMNLDREFTVDLREDDRFSRSHASPSIVYGIQFELYF